jgi:glycosyltransferase involved in cell wall biosynthesis
MSTIALFSTYAPSEGFGGPARIYHTRAMLESEGHTVIHVVIQANHAPGDARRSDIVRLVERPHGAPVDHIYADLALAGRAAADRRLLDALVAQLGTRGVDVILLEQPFLVDVVDHVSTALGAPVVYSCQNVEHRLLRELERFQPDWKRSKLCSAQVRDLEVKAVELAVAVTTIAETDRRMMLDEYGKDSTVVPNGSTLADGSVRRSGERIDFAFAGSSYWPNVEGFARIATPSLAFLPPTTRIHVAGSASHEILRNKAIDRRHSINASRLTLHGFVDADTLARLMGSATAVIVPVFIGEGSNLKSADALASGAPVIMTERATRGYEDVLAVDSEGVSVVESAEQFRAAMAASVAGIDRPAPVGLARRGRLGWAERLAPLNDVIAAAAGHTK